MAVCAGAGHVYLHALAFIIRLWTKTRLCSCVRNANAQVCVCVCETVRGGAEYEALCASADSSGSSVQSVQLRNEPRQGCGETQQAALV